MRLQTRISLLMCLGLITVLGFFTYLSVRVVEDTTNRIVYERLVVTEMAQTHVDTFLQQALFELSRAIGFATFDPEHSDLAEERHLMAHAYGQLGSFTQGLMLLDRQGVVVAAHPADVAVIGRDLSLQPFIKEALETGRSNVSNAFLNSTTNKPTVAVTLPVRSESGAIVSLLSGLIDLTSPQFANSLSHVARLGRTGHADIVDENGNIVVSSDLDPVLHPSEHPEFYTRMLQERKPAVETTPYVEGGKFKENHVMAFVPLHSARWGIGLGGSEAETFAPVRRLQIEASVFGLLALIAAFLLVWFTIRRVARPIEELIVASERMASGDLSVPISARGGDEVGRLAATFDRMRLKLHAAQAAQEELARAKEQFLSNVSHELRSPLGHVKGYVTTLLRQDAQWDERTRQRFLREVLAGTEQLQKMVDELLDMSRLEAGRFQVETEPVNIGQVTRAAVRWVRSETSNHRLVVSIPRDLPLALADPHRTEQVLRNLLENAVKYSPDGGCIAITGTVERGLVVICVADDGVGIGEGQLERIFERFHRVDNGLRRRTGGVGLGLSICRGIVEAQGGRIWAESVLGEGSRFYFSLPLFENGQRGFCSLRRELRQAVASGSRRGRTSLDDGEKAGKSS
ncbi:MAG: HAMP domain-containing protein [Chloroflexi bacterium]|nr:HAMP domain-containing protein [Chloroflexota bacterium]